MIKIRRLLKEDFTTVKLFISNNNEGFKDFFELGWNINNIKIQFQKTNNFSLGCFLDNKLTAILIGGLIINNELFELEIYILYVDNKFRRKNIGSSYFNHIISNKNLYKISKIYVEVAENNIKAVNFYEKNNFVFLNFRHNYYKYKNKIINAKCFFKII